MHLKLLLLAILVAGVSATKLHCNCGVEKIGQKILYGKEAIPHSHRWIVALYSTIGLKVYCAGTIINDRYILTAAHCFDEQIPYKLLFGAHDVSDITETISLEVDKVILHPEYRNTRSPPMFDIALIRMRQPIEFTDTIHPICLPTSKMGENMTNLLVAGWGVTETKESATKLMEVSVAQRPEDCGLIFGNVRSKALRNAFLSTTICAGNPKADSCEGDSGGPLMTKYRGKSHIVGVVSFGVTCGDPRVPAYYTSVKAYSSWIAKHTSDARYCDNKA